MRLHKLPVEVVRLPQERLAALLECAGLTLRSAQPVVSAPCGLVAANTLDVVVARSAPLSGSGVLVLSGGVEVTAVYSVRVSLQPYRGGVRVRYATLRGSGGPRGVLRPSRRISGVGCHLAI